MLIKLSNMDKNKESRGKKPKCHLQLEWIYGCRTHHCRNNVQYILNGEIVYFVGKVAIVFNVKEQRQRFYFGHSDEIISLAQFRKKYIVATGQIGKSPYICIWDAMSMETISILKDKHEKGISTMDFDKEGERLISVDLDEQPTINIWDWKSGSILATSKDICSRILFIQFCPVPNNIFVTVGLKSIKFWKLYGSYLDGHMGDFGEKGVVQTMLCVAFGFEQFIYSGSLNGDIYVWKFTKLETVLKDVHRGGVMTIHRNDNDNFVTGGKDGCIQMWNSEFKPISRVDLNYTADHFKGLNVRSVFWYGDKILVATNMNKIFEMLTRPSHEADCVMQGPLESDQFALAIHPHKLTFATGSRNGELKYVIAMKKQRIWNMIQKQLVHQIHANNSISACCFSPNAFHIATSFQNGSIIIFNSSDLSELCHIGDSAEAVNELKYSQDGCYLASATNNGNIFIYNSYKGYKKVAHYSKNSSPITHFDWSTNSKYLHCNNAEKESFHFRVPDGALVKDEIEIQSIIWATWTATVGPEVTGLYPKYNDNTHAICVDAYQEAGVMATGNANGNMELYGFPAYSKEAKSIKYVGLSGPVTCARFSHDKSRLISLSRNDNAIFQWSFISENMSEVVKNADNQIPKVHTDDFDDNSDFSDDDNGEIDPDLEKELQTTYHRNFDKEDIRSFNVKDTLKYNLPNGKGKRKMPNEGLSLDFVFGYRGFDCRNNLYFSQLGSMVYHVAAIGVVYNRENHKQKFYIQHTDDILCLCIHPIKDVVATGQVGKNPSVHVWDANSMKTLSILKGIHEYAIAVVQFSGDGKMLISIGLDEKHRISVWNWKKGQILATSWGSRQRILTVKWNPNDLFSFVTGGIRHLKFWTLAGSGFIYKSPVFGHLGEGKTMLAISFGKSPGYCYSASTNGIIFVWDGCTLIRTLKAHDGPIFCLQAIEKGFLSGGKDGIIQLWDDYLERSLRAYPVSKSHMMMGGNGQLIEDRPAIKACHLAHGKIIAGTCNSELLQMERTGCFQILNQSHAVDELWGLDVHPILNIAATFGRDKCVKIWDLDLQQMVNYKNLGKNGKCLAYASDGKLLAVGFLDGSCQIIHPDTLDTVEIIHYRNLEITVAKFSPIPGLHLAVGYQQGFVDIFTTFRWKWITVCKTRSDSVVNLDWDYEGKLLHVTTGSRNQFFYQIPSGDARTVSIPQQSKLQWSSWTSIVGLCCENIWTLTGNVCSEIHAACLSDDKKLLAIADSYGYLRLFTFPIKMRNPKSKWYYGHGSSVTNVKWLSNSNQLITVNRSDSAIMLWTRKVLMVDRKAEFDSDETDSDELENGFDSDVQNDTASHDPANPKMSELHVQEELPTASKHPEYKDCEPEVTMNGNQRLAMKFEITCKPTQVLELELDYIYGYQGSGYSGNLHSVNDEIVYSVASNVVALNNMSEKQSFYKKHTSLITSLTTNHHPQYQGILASGQLRRNPAIHLWSINSMQCLSLLKIANNRGIASLSFSGNGKLLLSAEWDDAHTLTIWRWEKGIAVARCFGHRNPILKAQFRPDSDTEFVTVGIKHVKFWTLVGGQLMGRRGIINVDCEGQLENDISIKTMLSVTFGKHDTAFTGATNGNIYIWKKHFLQKIIVRAHVGPIFAMDLTLRDGLITTGSKQFSGSNMDDAGVKLWDPEIRRCKPFPLRCIDSDIAVKSLTRSKGKIFMGTMDNCIHELIEKLGSFREIIHGHNRGGLWGICSHPYKHIIATTGDDHTVRIWDLTIKKCKGKVTLDAIGSCLQFSQDGQILVVGLNNGQIVIINPTSFKVLNKRCDHNRRNADIKVSPDNKYLAVADANCRVEIYAFSPGYQLLRVGYWQGQSSSSIKIDFCTDSNKILVTNYSYENTIIAVPEGYPIEFNSSLFHIKWATLSLFHPEFHLSNSEKITVDTTTVTCSAMSHCRNLLALGSSEGRLIIYKIKSTNTKDPYLKYTGHASPITAVQFTLNDQYIVTTERNHSSLFVWKLYFR